MKCTATDQAHARNVRGGDFESQMHGYLAGLTPVELGQVAEEAQRKNVAQLNRSAIAGRIKEAREETGLSQEEMALAMHVYKRTWQNYENVKKPRIPWDRLDDIAQITGKSTEWLIHGEKATPELLATLSSETQVEQGFVEFRDHVLDLHDDFATVNEIVRANNQLLFALANHLKLDLAGLALTELSESAVPRERASGSRPGRARSATGRRSRRSA